MCKLVESWKLQTQTKINLNTQIVFFLFQLLYCFQSNSQEKLRATKSFSFRGKRRKYPEGICRKILRPPFIEDVIRGSICFPTLFVDWYFRLLSSGVLFFIVLHEFPKQYGHIILDSVKSVVNPKKIHSHSQWARKFKKVQAKKNS